MDGWTEAIALLSVLTRLVKIDVCTYALDTGGMFIECTSYNE